MKDPILGSNKEQSFIEFETTEGKFRIGKEDSRAFIELNGSKIYLTNTDGTLNIGTVELGADAVPVARTNNPILGTNKVNVNIDLLDAAIGPDPTPVARTTGAIALANTVNANIDALDAAIGFEGQMSGTPHVVTFPTTIFQAIDKLDTSKSVQTVKITVGNVGVAGCDFNFASAANHAEQSINLGELLPAKARLVDVMIYTDAAFTNLGALTTDLGLASGTGNLIGAGNNTAIDAIMAAVNGGAFISTPNAAAQSIWLNVDPANNWDSENPAGRMSIYVTFINVRNI